MTREDVPFAVDITNREGWGYVDDDFHRMIDLEPDGCIVAFDEDQRVGMLTTINYGRTAWIGNVVVSPTLREEGIGSQLVKYAVENLRDKAVENVGLYSYMDSVSFYKKIGFKESFRVSRMSTKVDTSGTKATRRVMPKDLGEIAAFDSKHFPGNRIQLLMKMYEVSPHLFFQAGEDRVLGYVAGFCSPKACEIGPWVCNPDKPDLAESLLLDCMTALESNETTLAVPSKNEEAMAISRESGFTEDFDVVAMFYENDESEMDIDAIFAVGSLEMG